MSESYTYNSLTDNKKEEPKKESIEPVVKKPAKVKKKSKTKQKLMELFIPADIESVKEHIVEDLIVPRIKNLLLDALIDSVSSVLGIEKPSKSSTKHRSYNSLYDDRDSRRERETHTAHTYDDIVFETEREAYDVKNRLMELIEKNGEATILQYYDAARLGYLTSPSDNNYGWTDLSRAEVVRTYNREDRCYEYVIKMPRARHLG